ncbi:MAG: FtsX-like permease family protein [Planctomycetes bacterium]|nr:FtsX-like permease family protein [Planctomycetota bacterium]
MTALWRIALRGMLARPGQPLLALLAVVLGVAIVTGVDAANGSALGAFRRAVDGLAGRATHRITGGPRGVDERVYARLRREPALRAAGLRALAPVVDGTARLLEADGSRGRTLRVVGIDPFAEAPLRPWLAFGVDSGGGFDVGTLLTTPGGVLVSAATAASLGLEPGAERTIDVTGRRRAVRVVAVLNPRDDVARRGLDDVLVCDLATGQELLDRRDRLDRIDLALDGEAAAAEVAATLPPELRLEPRGDERGRLDELTRAFRLNLRALSMLALVVGALLVHNAMQLAVVRRRGLFGLLRALGAAPRQILATVLAEAAIIGTAGALLGLPLGIALARGMLTLVGATIEDLYAPVGVHAVDDLRAADLATAAALGIGASLCAALGPALEATRVAPRVAWSRADLERSAGRAVRLGVPVGLAAIALGLAAGELPVGGLPVAFGAVFLVLIGAACLTPAATGALLALATRPLGALLGLPGRQAARGARAGLSRTAVATAALSLAVAATVGLGVMVRSFRSTVTEWLDGTLIADVYASVPTTMATRTEARMAPDALRALLAVPGVADWSTWRRVDVASERGPVELAAVRTVPASLTAFALTAGDRATAAAALAGDDAVLASEPLAVRLGLQPGDRLRLAGDHGPVEVTVAAVFRDYATERGYAVLSRAAYDRHWDDDAVASVALWAQPGLDVDGLVDRLRDAAAGLDQELVIRSNRALREASLRIFDRTFEVTTALRLLCTLVAFLGILGALTTLQLERRRETAVLRALGATPWQAAAAVVTQNALLGACAGLLAIPTGIALGWLLVDIVQRRSFGWSLLTFDVPPGVLASAVALATGAALLAALWPAWRVARQPLVDGLREE